MPLAKLSSHRVGAALIASVLLAPSALAQNGDRKGEVQGEVPAHFDVPPAPVLDPEAALASFKIAPGYRIELVAAEPLIEDPVAIEFGPDGRIWVVEMRGYMPDIDGNDEQAPVGRISVLSDTDGDGRMDTSKVFADELILPRGIALHRDGALVIEPPRMLFLRDTDGDGVADQREVIIDRGFEPGLKNPEHAGNSPVWGIDNVLAIGNFNRRLRRDGDGLVAVPGMVSGQWGLSRDDAGNFFYDYNSDYVRADHVPSHYAIRNRHMGRAGGVNHRLDNDQKVYPGRINPGVNRGYRKGTLREDGRLARFTAACAPLVYRGDLMDDCRGDVFVCEPAGNLVRRSKVTVDEAGRMQAKNAHPDGEFLTSTDERFRPVFLANGFDGGLYIVDLYRGIVQHKVFMTTFLRKQVLDRGLDKPKGLGRIYRVVKDSGSRDVPPSLLTLDDRGLVERLGDDNGFIRDAAQRLLVEHRARSVAAPLRRVMKRSENPLHRLHVLWTLDGIGALRRGGVARGLTDADPRVRAAAVRLAEARFASADGAELFAAVVALTGDSDPSVRRQVALSLGAAPDRSAGDAALRQLLREHGGDPWLPSLVVSGLQGRELEFLRGMLADSSFAESCPGAADALKLLARCVVRQKNGARVTMLVDTIGAEAKPWRQRAMLGGAVAALPRGKQAKGWLRLDAPPAKLAALCEHADGKVQGPATKLRGAMTFAQSEPVPVVTELTADQKKLFAQGKAMYAICMACHQANGQGLPGLAPPLAESEWVAGPDHRLARIVLHGLAGPIEVKGQQWNLVMPGQPALTDEQIAGVLTYVRRSFGNELAPVSPETVKKVRAEEAERGLRPWTAAELMQKQ